MLRDGFGENPWFGCLIAEELQPSRENHSLPKRRAIGYVIFYQSYSTWKGRSLYIEDVYVEPASRGVQLIKKEVLHYRASTGKPFFLPYSGLKYIYFSIFKKRCLSITGYPAQ